MHRINIINPDYMTTEPTYDVYQDIQSESLHLSFINTLNTALLLSAISGR